jgi:uncharacterized protein (TIGR02147 family)
LGPTLRTQFSQALKLKAREAQFFELLARFNQTSDLVEKCQLLSSMSRFKNSRAKLISEGQYRYFTKWYYPVIWNYFGISQKVKSPTDLGAFIHPPISAGQVEEGINLLRELGLIKKMANGYAVTEKHLTTEPEFRGLVATEYSQHFLELATQALRTVEPKSRQFGTMVFSVSHEAIKTIKERMTSFQEEVQEIIEQDTKSECVYTLGMQLFPNTKPPKD